MKTIETDKFSAALRGKAIKLEEGKLLVSRLRGSEQEKDLSEPPNCDGFGRIRHFHRRTADGWPENPLPIDPALHRLGLSEVDVLKAQVFQNAACNWRCWYCFVPFTLLNASEKLSGWLSAAELVDLYIREPDRPSVIDLSGGQPDLTPEWIPWMMGELQCRGLADKVYLWSDDNLSNDYFWRFLDAGKIDLIRSYQNYGKVCCFKGFDSDSFAFNTKAHADLFERQFELFGRYLELGIDLYAYTTFTSPCGEAIEKKMATFVDRLQALHPQLPLRTVPLEIRAFAPVHQRMDSTHHAAIVIQQEAIACWNREISKRFSEAERARKIYEVQITC